jgi:hypothetical protein
MLRVAFAVGFVLCTELISGHAAAQDGQTLPTEDRVQEITRALVLAQWTNEHDVTWRLLSDEFQAITTRDAFVANEAAIVEERGTLAGFQARRVTAYPEQGAVAVDFIAAYANGFYACGYHVWQAVDTHAGLELVRIERNFWPAAVLDDPNAAPLLAQLGCVPMTTTGFDIQVP